MRLARRFALPTSILLITGLATGIQPAYAEHASKPAATAPRGEATALSLARTSGKPVVVESATTETEQVFALPNGTMRLVVNASPVRVKEGGVWVPIDSTLTTEKGFLVPEAASTPVQFGVAGSTILARIQTESGAWLEEVSPFGPLPAPVVEGATATYPEVLPGVDLQLSATGLGMSEVLVVKSAKAAANPALAAVEFTMSGAALSSASGGGVTATAADGSIVRSSTPTWWDSSYGSDADGPAGNVSPQVVGHRNTASSVVLDVAATTKSRTVTYPVYVDPDWTGNVLSFWQIDQAYPTQSYLNGAYADGEQRVGYVTAAYSPDNRNHLARSFWQMNTSGVTGKHVISAQFSAVEDWAFNCTPSPVQLWSSTDIAPGTTWNNTGNPYLQILDTKTEAHRAGGAGACATAAVGFNATVAVVAAAAGTTGITTLALRAENEASNSGWKRFEQSSASLTITYNSAPTVTGVSLASPARVCGTAAAPAYVNSTSGVLLKATLGDVDAGASVKVDFFLALASNLAATTTYTSAAAAVGVRSVTVPASALPEGSYAYKAQAFDGVDYSAVSAWCYFVVDNTAPTLPTQVMTALPSPLFVGQSVTAKFSAVLAEGVAGFAFWWAPTASTYPSPSVPILLGGSAAIPACNSTVGPVSIICPNSSGVAQKAVAPIDMTSTLWVASFDKAGNIGTDSLGSFATPREFFASPSTAFSYASGHGWITDAYVLPLTGSLIDSNVDGSGLPPIGQSPITLGPGATMVARTITGAAGPTPVVSLPGTTSDVAANASKSSTQVIDTKNSFTASVWVDRGAATDTGTYYALSIVGAGTTSPPPAMAIRLLDGHWQFCVTPQVSPAPLFEYCAEDPSVASTDWTFVTGVWDSVNRVVRLTINGDISSTIIAPVGILGTNTSALGPLVLGSVVIGARSMKQWKGELANPTIFPGVIDSGRLIEFFYFHTFEPV